MTRRPPPLPLDFVAPVHRARAAGLLLCLAGLLAVLSVGVAFQRQSAERGRLEAALEAATPPRRSAPSADSVRRTAQGAAMARELGVPWTRLLGELERASSDSEGKVSLLQVEPDPGKRMVRITAEVRTLDDALDYLERLQQSAILRYPMLESHEVRKDDAGHPLRIKVSAEWRT